MPAIGPRQPLRLRRAWRRLEAISAPERRRLRLDVVNFKHRRLRMWAAAANVPARRRRATRPARASCVRTLSTVRSRAADIASVSSCSNGMRCPSGHSPDNIRASISARMRRCNEAAAASRHSGAGHAHSRMRQAGLVRLISRKRFIAAAERAFRLPRAACAGPPVFDELLPGDPDAIDEGFFRRKSTHRVAVGLEPGAHRVIAIERHEIRRRAFRQARGRGERRPAPGERRLDKRPPRRGPGLAHAHCAGAAQGAEHIFELTQFVGDANPHIRIDADPEAPALLRKSGALNVPSPRLASVTGQSRRQWRRSAPSSRAVSIFVICVA